jgi:hypothetical protein
MWRTSIVAAQVGNEQRSMLFTHPRIKISFVVSPATYAENAWFARALHLYLHGLWGVPVWTDGTELTSAAAADQPVLAVDDTTFRRFYQGRQCILIDKSDWTSYEVGTVLSTTSTQITLSSNLSSAWSSAWVYPLFEGRLSNQQKYQSMQIDLSLLNLEFTESLDSGSVLVDTYSPSVDTYLGEDVFSIQPNWISPPDTILTNDWRSIGSLGVESTSSLADETIISIYGYWTCTSRPDWWAMREFFMSRAGRLDGFWVPSWRNDINVTAAIGASDTTITIEDIDYDTTWFLNSCTGRHLAFFLPDGTTVYRTVETAPSSTTITISSAIGSAVTAGNLNKLMVSFLYYVRFAQDELEASQSIPEIAEYNLTMTSIPSEAPII